MCAETSKREEYFACLRPLADHGIGARQQVKIWSLGNYVPLLNFIAEISVTPFHLVLRSVHRVKHSSMFHHLIYLEKYSSEKLLKLKAIIVTPNYNQQMLEYFILTYNDKIQHYFKIIMYRFELTAQDKTNTV